MNVLRLERYVPRVPRVQDVVHLGQRSGRPGLVELLRGWNRSSKREEDPTEDMRKHICHLVKEAHLCVSVYL